MKTPAKSQTTQKHQVKQFLIWINRIIQTNTLDYPEKRLGLSLKELISILPQSLHKFIDSFIDIHKKFIPDFLRAFRQRGGIIHNSFNPFFVFMNKNNNGWLCWV